MSKVKVNQKVYDAFKITEGPVWCFEDKERYLRNMISYKADSKFNSITSALNEISFETFLKALNNGYELELTPHEKIKKIFDENIIASKEVGALAIYSTGFLDGLSLTLEYLGEEVEGVNK